MEKGTEKKREREGESSGERQRRERGIEERNQRRLSAYEVGIVGWRRFVRSLRITRRWVSIVAGGAKAFDAEADVFSKWRRISR